MPEVQVMEQVVAGIYAPLIHGFIGSVIDNIKLKRLPSLVVTPPRDAIPLTISLRQMSKIKDQKVKVLTPALNRNTAGIANNQKSEIAEMDPLFPQLLNQMTKHIKEGVLELETGIYGTTSLVMARHLKDAGIDLFVPMKFYGLGPNISFVHGVLSEGKSWIAEESENKCLVNKDLIKSLMVLVDSLEEFGMQNFYHSVEKLQKLTSGRVVPVAIKQPQSTWSIAYATNMAVKNSAKEYSTIKPNEIKAMLEKVPWLIEQSRIGFPLTLEEAIPSMDSKESHYSSIRKEDLFCYPKDLVINGRGMHEFEK